MDKVRIRPRYNFSVMLKKDEVLSKLKNALEKKSSSLTGKFVKPLVVISIIEKDQHFWSPELSLDIEEKDKGSEIRCTLGPRSSLWTMFATFYGFSILVGIAGLVLGFSQLTLGMRSYGFWLVPISILLILLAYAIALTGQRLSYKQMLELRSFIKETLKNSGSFQQ